MNSTLKTTAPAIVIRDEELFLLPERAIYWKRKNALLLSDLHLGKSGHFRKSGIAVSSQVHHDDLQRLSHIIAECAIKKIYLLGDLFHSRHNSEWLSFVNWRNQYPEIEIHLVKGNHDILDDALMVDADIFLHHETLLEPPFILSHQLSNHPGSDFYSLYGHIHPGVLLSGKALQSFSLPCFCFGKKSGVLPAFGSFTGLSLITPCKSDSVFVIYGNDVKLILNAPTSL